MVEIFKDIKGFEGYYQISNLGKVKSFHSKNKIIKNTINNQGYCYVRLFLKNKKTKLLVHRLIAIAFIENPSNKKFINHIDGNKLNNDISNLEWCTHKENMQHAHSNNLINYNKIKIKQYDKKNNFIKEYESIKEAAIYIGDKSYCSNIVKCLKNKINYAYGYKWVYY